MKSSIAVRWIVVGEARASKWAPPSSVRSSVPRGADRPSHARELVGEADGAANLRAAPWAPARSLAAVGRAPHQAAGADRDDARAVGVTDRPVEGARSGRAAARSRAARRSSARRCRRRRRCSRAPASDAKRTPRQMLAGTPVTRRKLAPPSVERTRSAGVGDQPRAKAARIAGGDRPRSRRLGSAIRLQLTPPSAGAQSPVAPSPRPCRPPDRRTRPPPQRDVVPVDAAATGRRAERRRSSVPLDCPPPSRARPPTQKSA